ncbi:MAG TPA: hypothetical protein VKB79_31150 [Bryobacteraceae bacterium]|nr:hypothetical protein [Bryobacteraceae bacterium]
MSEISVNHTGSGHLSDDDLVLLYYKEPGVPGAVREHVLECPQCAASAERLARTLNACDEWVPPEPEADFGRSIWAQIAPQMADRRRPRFSGWFKVAVAFAATAALLIVAFVAGRATRGPAPSITAGLSRQARERILAISLADHLDRVEMLLTEVSNADDTDVSQFQDNRLRAQDLVDEGRLMRQTLARSGESATLSLLDEVERFMLEVANAPEQMTPEDVRELRGRIGSGSLLFKVRIIESNLRTEGQRS